MVAADPNGDSARCRSRRFDRAWHAPGGARNRIGSRRMLDGSGRRTTAQVARGRGRMIRRSQVKHDGARQTLRIPITCPSLAAELRAEADDARRDEALLAGMALAPVESAAFMRCRGSKCSLVPGTVDRNTRARRPFRGPVHVWGLRLGATSEAQWRRCAAYWPVDGGGLNAIASFPDRADPRWTNAAFARWRWESLRAHEPAARGACDDLGRGTVYRRLRRLLREAWERYGRAGPRLRRIGGASARAARTFSTGHRASRGSAAFDELADMGYQRRRREDVRDVPAGVRRRAR